MNSSRVNYCLSLAILPLFISLTALGQSKSVNGEQCVISFLAGSRKELKQIAEDEKPPTELGRIDISKVTEGTGISKTYRIPNSQLNVLVELLFDDDLSLELDNGRVPTDAMTLWLTIWNGPKRNPKSVLAMAINQSAYPNFVRSITTAYATKGSKSYFVLVDCTVDLKKENDKP